MKGIITVDIGTTSLRAILYDREARALHLDQRENPPVFHGDGRVEQRRVTLAKCRERIAQLRRQQQDIEATIAELTEFVDLVASREHGAA